MTFTRALLDDLAADPAALAELRQLIAAAEPDEPRLLTPAEVADRLGLSTRTVNRYATEGRLEAVKVGRYWRFTPDAILQAVSAPVPPADPAPRRRARQPKADYSAARAILGE